MSFTRRNVAIRTPAQRGPAAGSAVSSADASNPSPTTRTPAPPSSTSHRPSLDRASATSYTSSSSPNPSPSPPSNRPPPRLAGTRASPVDGRPTTSTGCASLDGLLAGHAGLALGASLLLGEHGATDYAATLLRYFAAQGVVHGHAVTVVGPAPDAGWARGLPMPIGPAQPGAAAGSSGGERAGGEDYGREGGEGEGGGGGGKSAERMKIAWRYEKLGEARGPVVRAYYQSWRQRFVVIVREDLVDGLHGKGPFTGFNWHVRPAAPGDGSSVSASEPFCHAFDLTKRLALPSADSITFLPVDPDSEDGNPFAPIQQALTQLVSKSPPDRVHRIVIPSLLDITAYPPTASTPGFILPFLHFLRGLLRTHPARLCLLASIPLSLYPRSAGLTRWIELLSDGVLELVPFPHAFDNQVGTEAASSLGTSGAATALEERPQGLLHVHRLPVFHERGGGGVAGTAGVDDDLAFTVSRRKFVIKPFSLPPLEGDTEAQQAADHQKPPDSPAGKTLPKKEDLEF